MINFKSIKWGFGVVASLILGLSGCYMDGAHPSYREYPPEQATKMKRHDAVQVQEETKGRKVHASKEPVQKSTPGPKRVAAPQMPVIQ